MLLGADARPIAVNGSAEEVERRWREGESGIFDQRGQPISAKFLSGAATSFLEGLRGTRRPSEWRATDPFGQHAWVYAAAMAVAVAKSQAAPTVWRETDAEVERRAIRAKRMGRPFVAGRGRRRRAVQRHLTGGILRRLFVRGLEPDFDHPRYELLANPNPHQDLGQLFTLTDIFLQVYGECFWVFTGPSGEPVGESGEPEEIWPFSPELFLPVYSRRDRGELQGWRMRAPRLSPDGLFGDQREIFLELEEVAHFKLPNPMDPARGLSMIAAAAQAIEMDLAVHEHGRALLRNDAVPKGIVAYKGMVDEKEQEEIQRRWEERHKGKDKAGRTAFLFNGFEYQTLGLAPADMQFLQQREWDRTEVLAALGVPPSVVGVTDVINHATALAQDKSFWEKRIIPLCRIEESVIERALFFPEPDTTFFGFDMRGIEALRIGVAEKIKAAREMCGQELHTPPRVAFEVVGLEVPEYEGDDVPLVSALATPLEDVLSGDIDLALPGAPPPAPADDPEDGEPAAPAEDAEADQPEAAAQGAPLIRSSRARKGRAGKIWRAFVRVEVALESKMRRAYRAWTKAERAATLERFDRAARDGRTLRTQLAAVRKALNLQLVLPDLKLSGDALKEKSRPIYVTTTEETFELTLAEIGVPTFAIDDARIVAHWDEREKIFTRSVPQTLYDNLRSQLSAGIEAGETVQQLRVRVGQVYDVAASSSKSLLIARTETASLMNGIRDEMFGLSGVTEQDWISAGDEATRADHLAYADAGSRPRGFNWLGIQDSTGRGGVLEYPGDTRAPVGQVANCRCAAGAVA